MIDHHQWLIDNNLLTEEIKGNIAMVAYCLIEDTIDASTDIDFENNLVTYKIVIDEKIYNNMKLLEKYESGVKLGFFELRRLKKFLLDKAKTDEIGLGYKLDDIANKFVSEYLNKKWKAKVHYKSVNDYDGKKDIWLHGENNQRID